MSEAQGDLFADTRLAVERPPPRDDDPPAVSYAGLGSDSLIAALPAANMASCLAILDEIRIRRLAEAIPELDRICQRLQAFGVSRIVPEQAAALDALVAIGGTEACRVVARLIARGAIQGPTLRQAVMTVVELRASLPQQTLARLLRHPDIDVCTRACRCIKGSPSPDVIRALRDLLEDRHGDVRSAAACALGRLGRIEARSSLIALLQDAPSPDVIEAIIPVADQDCIVLLGRLAHKDIGLRMSIIDALDAIDHPQAEKLAGALRKQEKRS